MKSRLELHAELVKFYPNAYYQPPSNIQMKYPCIVYNKSGKMKTFASDSIYRNMQEYSLTLIERDPDSTVADEIEKHFDYCSIVNYFTSDNLNHTNLSLYY